MDGPGRKRVNDRELTKDNAHDDGEETGETGGVTFERANDAVLAGRRIVKARRPPAGVTRASGATAAGPGPESTPASGLFSGFSLLNQAPKSPASAAVGDSDAPAGASGEMPRDEADLDPRGRPVPPMPDPEVEEGPPKPAEGGVTSDPETSDDEITSKPKKPFPQASGEGTSEKQSEGKSEKGSEGKEEKSGGGGKGGAKAATDKPPSGFKFGGSDGFAKLSSAPNAFASGFGGTTSAPVFSFGLAASSAAATSTPSTSPATNAGPTQSAFPSLSSVFGSANGAKVQLFGAGAAGSPEDEGDNAAAAGPVITPAVSLPAVDVVIGKEEEKALFAAEASLFEFVEGGKWKERGKGEVRLNASDKEMRPVRLVMRARGNLRLLLNAYLFPEMKVTKMDRRGMSFACVNSAEDTAEGSPKPAISTWALRLKDPVQTAELLELIETHKLHKPAGTGKETGGGETVEDVADVEAGKATAEGGVEAAPAEEKKGESS